jgi:ABC-type multidrug transport system fused ATPase/permease subunit
MSKKTENRFARTVLGRLSSLLTKSHKKRLAGVSSLLFFSALVNVGGIASIVPFMQVLANPEIVQENRYLHFLYTFSNSPDIRFFLILIGIIVLLIFITGNLFMAFSTYVRHMYVQSISSWFTSRLLSGYLKQPYEFFLNRNAAELSKNIFSEVTEVVNNVMTPSMEAVSHGFLSLTIIVLLFIIDPFVALMASLVLGGSYLFIFRIVKKRITRLGKSRVKANRERFRIAAEALGGIKQVKLSSREHDYMNRFSPHSKKFEQAKAKNKIIGEFPKYALEIIAMGGILAIALVLFAIEGTLVGVLPILSLYVVSGYRLMPSLQKFFQAVTRIRGAGASVAILYEDMKTFAEPVDDQEDFPSDIKQDKIQQISFETSITLNKITFAYPNFPTPILADLDLKIEKNTTVGFVGPTGCGKTTLIDILLGLLIPQDGSYTVDKYPIDDSNRRLWQKNMGYVPQDIYLADDTVTSNIAFGVPKAEVDFEAVVSACRIANIDEFIVSELTNGYETVVGERGIRLSGGQRQRMGIARALYHNPELLILDEATSALDSKTELAIMDAIRALTHNKTIIMIAHRITTLRDCDRIYVLDRGNIIDSGTYLELSTRNEHFKEYHKTEKH